VRKFYAWIILIFITSPLFSQTYNYQVNQTRPKSTDLLFYHRLESIQVILKPPILIIDNPRLLKYIPNNDRYTLDLFTNMSVQNSGKYELALSKNNVIKFIAGGVGGTLVGLAGGLIGVGIEDCSSGGDLCGLAGFLIGGFIGYQIGIPMGVSVAGNMSNENGSYGEALLGSVLFQLLASPILLGENQVVFGIWLASGPIGATIGYNRSRKFESNDRLGTALINLNGRQIELAAPMIYFHRIQSTNRHVQMIDILRVDL